MDLAPFTLAEAEEICEDFEDMIDTDFSVGGSVFLVDNVAVCPFDDAEKELFTDNYYQTRSAADAISFYTGSDYDVVLLLSNADDESQHSYMTIRSYLAEKGVHYNFPE